MRFTVPETTAGWRSRLLQVAQLGDTLRGLCLETKLKEQQQNKKMLTQNQLKHFSCVN